MRAIEINTRRQAEMCVEREIKRQGEERESVRERRREVEREGTAKTSLKNAKLADRRRVSQLKSSKTGKGGRHI